VATICWRCGTQVPDGAQACPACGAAIQGAAAPAAPGPVISAGQGYVSPPPPPAAPPAAPFQPMGGQAPPSYTPVQSMAPPQPGYAPVQGGGFTPAPPPPPAVGQASAGGGSSAVKIILIIVAIIVGIGILGAGVVGYGIYRVAHAVHQAAHGGTVTIPGAGGGSLTMSSSQTFSASELGTDPYPGATTTRGGMKMSTPGGSWITGVFLTSDPPDQVLSFYKGKLGSNASVTETENASVLTLKSNEQETVMVTISSRPNEDNGKTKIVILHTKANKT
jgi:hypothetical protein